MENIEGDMTKVEIKESEERRPGINFFIGSVAAAFHELGRTPRFIERKAYLIAKLLWTSYQIELNDAAGNGYVAPNPHFGGANVDQLVDTLRKWHRF